MTTIIAQTPDAPIPIQDIIVGLQFISTCLLGWLAYKSYKRDSSKIQMDMYDSIEKLQMLYLEKFDCEVDSNQYKMLINIQEHLCNRYEIISYEYLQGRFAKKLFYDMYLNSIIQNVEDENFSEFYSEDGEYNCYNFTLKVYKEAILFKGKNK